jgi:L-ascorbate metabolism protein UlaG (beta-lactamase superfamily)
MNVIGTLARRAVPFLRDQYVRERKRPIAASAHKPSPELWPDTGLHAAWLGHSTVLLKIDGFTILTDPVFSDRIGLNFGPLTVGMKRLVAPALGAGDVPQPDLVLLSHAHMDHFDRPSLRALESPTTRVVTASKTSDLLRAGNYRDVTELGWNETARIGGVNVRAFEVKHWGARVQRDTYRGYNGYLIETPRGVDLAIMPIGAYNPWVRVHCTPEQAVRMANDAGADCILPVHHQTFRLSQEPRLEPIERLSLALAGSSDRLGLREIGQELHR